MHRMLPAQGGAQARLYDLRLRAHREFEERTLAASGHREAWRARPAGLHLDRGLAAARDLEHVPHAGRRVARHTTDQRISARFIGHEREALCYALGDAVIRAL